eukprot:TRINITY_DN10774_c0_g1_i1.p1 TRINITY_DN10774_c0_g1~~TRINITY_DN10774_c0_g1_i1.p1  ORF type:complete len:1184 (-),score=310.95 TRINITY_DN10774_c0_g1_i1:87-3638(-)
MVSSTDEAKLAKKARVLDSFRCADEHATGRIPQESFLKLLTQLLVVPSTREDLEGLLQEAGFAGDDVPYEAFLDWLFSREEAESIGHLACGAPRSAVAALKDASPTAGSAANSVTEENQTKELLYFADPESILKEIATGDVVLVRGQWLVELARTPNARLPRRQELPPEAVWDTSSLRSLMERIRRRINFLPIAVVSYCWLAKHHPDPSGDQLKTLSHITKLFVDFIGKDLLREDAESGDAAIFLDWCSLYQEPRSEEELAAFVRSLSSVNLWYGHQGTTKWLLTSLPPGSEARPYNDRGWPTFERAVAELTTPYAMVLDLARLSKRHATYTRAWRSCKAGRRPPVVPDDFAKMLETKVFTNGHDKSIVTRKHRDTFNAVTSGVEEIVFRQLEWSDEDMKDLVTALLKFSVLRSVDLQKNRIGDPGAVLLADSFEQCAQLHQVKLAGNRIGGDGSGALKTAWTKAEKPQSGLMIGQQTGAQQARSLSLGPDDAVSDSTDSVYDTSSDEWDSLDKCSFASSQWSSSDEDSPPSTCSAVSAAGAGALVSEAKEAEEERNASDREDAPSSTKAEQDAEEERTASHRKGSEEESLLEKKESAAEAEKDAAEKTRVDAAGSATAIATFGFTYKLSDEKKKRKKTFRDEEDEEADAPSSDAEAEEAELPMPEKEDAADMPSISAPGSIVTQQLSVVTSGRASAALASTSGRTASSSSSAAAAAGDEERAREEEDDISSMSGGGYGLESAYSDAVAKEAERERLRGEAKADHARLRAAAEAEHARVLAQVEAETAKLQAEAEALLARQQAQAEELKASASCADASDDLDAAFVSAASSRRKPSKGLKERLGLSMSSKRHSRDSAPEGREKMAGKQNFSLFSSSAASSEVPRPPPVAAAAAAAPAAPPPLPPAGSAFANSASAAAAAKAMATMAADAFDVGDNGYAQILSGRRAEELEEESLERGDELKMAMLQELKANAAFMDEEGATRRQEQVRKLEERLQANRRAKKGRGRRRANEDNAAELADAIAPVTRWKGGDENDSIGIPRAEEELDSVPERRGGHSSRRRARHVKEHGDLNDGTLAEAGDAASASASSTKRSLARMVANKAAEKARDKGSRSQEAVAELEQKLLEGKGVAALEKKLDERRGRRKRAAKVSQGSRSSPRLSRTHSLEDISEHRSKGRSRCAVLD